MSKPKTPNEFLHLLLKRTPEEQDRIEAEWARREQAERERLELERRRRWAAWGIPSKDIARIASDELTASQALSATREFEEHQAIVLVLAGAVGCGKTTAAAHWLIHARRRQTYIRPDPRRFLPVAELARLNRFDDDAMSRVERASELVIDDLGAEYLDDKGAFASMLDGVVDARYRHLLPTVITTNANGDQFKARFGARIVDRIRELGEFVELNGSSLRRA